VNAPDLIEIADPADPRLEIYRNQKDAWLAVQRGMAPDDKAAGLFMAEGVLVVRTLIESGQGVKSVLVSENRVASMTDAFARLSSECPVYVVSREVLTEVVGFDLHRGVLAAGIRPTMPSLESVVASSRTLVVLEGISNHDNMGGLLRSAAALGGLESVGVVLCPRCCDPLYRKAIRVSMGTALRVRWTVATEWPDCLQYIRESGFTTYALALGAGSVELRTISPALKVAIVLGAEGPGLSPEAIEACSQRVKIGIDPGVDSLNVAVAGSIALAHLSSMARHGGNPGRSPSV